MPLMTVRVRLRERLMRPVPGSVSWSACSANMPDGSTNMSIWQSGRSPAAAASSSCSCSPAAMLARQASAGAEKTGRLVAGSQL